VTVLRLDLVPSTVLVICRGTVILLVPPLVVVLQARTGIRRSDEKSIWTNSP
jgi:hypothetical protein